MRWRISDGCSDGRGLQVKFYDKTDNLVWPSSTQHYVADPGGEVDATLACTRGNKICFGATTDPSSNTYWGIGLDGDKGCDNCCYSCEDGTFSRNLVCS